MREQITVSGETAARTPWSGEFAGSVMTIVGGICWGLSGCCGQFLFEHRGVQAPWLVALRLLFAGLMLIINGFILNRKDNLRIFKHKRDVRHLLVFALFGITFCQFSYFMAVQSSNAGTATVLQYLSPVLILFIMCVRGRRRPRGLELLAIALSLTGTFLIGTHGNIHGLQLTPQGLMWGLLAAVSAVIYTTLPGTLVNRYDIYQVLGFGMFIGGLFMCLLVRPWTYAVVWDGGTWAAMFGVIVVGTAVAFGLYLQGVSIIGPLKGSLYSGVEPVSSIIISVFWLHTSFTRPDFLGFGLIMATVFILAKTGGGQEKEATGGPVSSRPSCGEQKT